jgi:hypothetical protein
MGRGLRVGALSVLAFVGTAVLAVPVGIAGWRWGASSTPLLPGANPGNGVLMLAWGRRGPARIGP